MTVETKFVTDEEGRIAVSEKRGTKELPPDNRFFHFQTRTVFTTSAGSTIAIRTNRRMAAGLLEYFLDNKLLQDRVLKQNEDHAKNFFNRR
jgi:hypothetical protein